MINRKFIEETDKLIARFKEREISIENGNIIVAKVKAEEVTAGGLVLPKSVKEMKDYHNGLARILSTAGNVDPQYKIGDYVIHAHESRYKLFKDALREFLNDFIEEDLVYAIQDNNVIMSIKGENIQ